MATLTEVTVVASITIARDSDGTQHAWLSASSYSSTGQPIRQINDLDIYPLLGTTAQSRVGEVIDYVVARLKTYWEIP